MLFLIQDGGVPTYFYDQILLFVFSVGELVYLTKSPIIYPLFYKITILEYTALELPNNDILYQFFIWSDASEGVKK